MKQKLTEQRICEILMLSYPEGDIYPEVPVNGGIIDLVIVDKPLIIAIEAKVTLSLQLMEQAVARIGHANYVYVATPVHPSGMQEKFLKHFGIGVLRVSEHGQPQVKEVVKPKLYRNIKKPTLEEWMKKSIAGTQSQRVTAFGHFVSELVRDLLDCPEGKTYKQLFESGRYNYYHKFSSFKNNIYQYVNRGVIKNLFIDNGRVVHEKYLKPENPSKDAN